jgi:hypothetical protein
MINYKHNDDRSKMIRAMNHIVAHDFLCHNDSHCDDNAHCYVNTYALDEYNNAYETVSDDTDYWSSY